MFLIDLVRATLARCLAKDRTAGSASLGPAIWADLARLDELMAGETDDLPVVFTLMDPGGRDFGTDVAAFIDHCCEQQVLHVAAPVAAVGIEATVGGDYRDGGFLVMVTIADRITVASGQLLPEVFRGADDLPRWVLAVVIDVADQVYRELVRTAADLTGSAS
ncbi:hypothetical protein [Actinoplanes sp. NBRC 103695]|uniref:hypothetical protein n=1 Tax=Actinoplanes sp. NBRC 103695 TaxID=3032202 RepID=UPI0024A4FD21|nr:hypothetical protein [Actinoplanes sp. NBRC 103695]GLZ00800.1 hypothetical protein Acsp02_80520 [Actinoplanes sp. NBRC 103695]